MLSTFLRIDRGTAGAAGEWLQVSLAVLGVIAVFVMALWACTEPILRLLGKDELVSDASFFSLVLMSCIPARVIFSQLTQYLSAQGIVKASTARHTSSLSRPARCTMLRCSIRMVDGARTHACLASLPSRRPYPWLWAGAPPLAPSDGLPRTS